RNYGLTQALLSFTDKISNVTNIQFSLNSNLQSRLPETTEFTVYRTLTELINTR
ncbi:MAG: hypothetical protein HC896_16295, partial [Bacteroidales bacterium]|nr:hypothetical protein [Bacteroidales bacterium]